MAAFAKPTTSNVTLCSQLPPANNMISQLICGEDIALGDACYIKSDGKVWRSIGTTANAAAKVDGYAMTSGKVLQADAVTLVHGVMVAWANAGTPGARLYLSATAGQLDTAVTTGGTAPIGFIVDANRVFLKQSGY